jgi:hypothetical protein
MSKNKVYCIIIHLIPLSQSITVDDLKYIVENTFSNNVYVDGIYSVDVQYTITKKPDNLLKAVVILNLIKESKIRFQKKQLQSALPGYKIISKSITNKKLSIEEYFSKQQIYYVCNT